MKYKKRMIFNVLKKLFFFFYNNKTNCIYYFHNPINTLHFLFNLIYHMKKNIFIFIFPI